ncbi:MAG: hypothetical protein HWN68_09990 [Desulfobacterales bacterium]|nr:hypothetical protein [Desulfobacterales bacterium]
MPLYQQGGLSEKGFATGGSGQRALQSFMNVLRAKALKRQQDVEQRKLGMQEELQPGRVSLMDAQRKYYEARARGEVPEQAMSIADFLASVPEDMKASYRVGPEGGFTGGYISPETEPRVHTPHYIQQILGQLQTGSPYSPFGIPMETLTTPEEYIAFATKNLGPEWQKHAPRAVDIINKKFPGAVGAAPKSKLAPYWKDLPDNIKAIVQKKLLAGNSEDDVIAALKKDGHIK